jgi:hypothetical protein
LVFFFDGFLTDTFDLDIGVGSFHFWTSG